MNWVSVKDKIPKKNHEVLFVNGKNEVSVGSLMPYEPGNDIWASDYSIYFNDTLQCELATCKFWMPLPNPPEEKK